MMDYFFTIKSTLNHIDSDKAKQLFQTVEFHEQICQKIPGTALDIQCSELAGDRYYLEREYNLDLEMPELIRKLLKDAFRLRRHDYWDFQTLSASSTLKSNLPGILSYQTFLSEAHNAIQVRQDWKLDIGIPLIHKALARFAETEIRKFHAIEMDIIQQELIAQTA